MGQEEVPSGSTGFRRNPHLIEELEQVFKTHRLDVVQPPDGFLVTPLHVVKKLAQENKMDTHSEVYALHVGGEEGEDRLYRVEILVGQARGIGQAPLKGVAFQLAAANMLEKIAFYNDMSFPPYGLPPGFRIHPNIVRDLRRLCKGNDLEEPTCEIIPSNQAFEERELYDCVVTVGQMTAYASSDSRQLARRLAYLQMWNLLAVHQYPFMPLAIGNECFGHKQLKAMGMQVLSSKTKVKWFNEYRRSPSGKLLYFDDEPDDGDDMEVLPEPDQSWKEGYEAEPKPTHDDENPIVPPPPVDEDFEMD